jgi:hypothetical protein
MKIRMLRFTEDHLHADSETCRDVHPARSSHQKRTQSRNSDIPASVVTTGTHWAWKGGLKSQSQVYGISLQSPEDCPEGCPFSRGDGCKATEPKPLVRACKLQILNRIGEVDAESFAFACLSYESEKKRKENQPEDQR